PDHRDALAHAPRALVEGALHPFAEGEQENDGQGPPGDGQDGQHDPLALVARVALEEAQGHGHFGAEVAQGLHASLRATTGSRREARRAGKYPATVPMAPRSRAVVRITIGEAVGVPTYSSSF